MAELVQAEQVEGVLDAPSHRARRDAQVLHRVGELVLDDVAHEAGRRVLAHHPDQIGELTWRMGAGRASAHSDLAGEPATGEVRHETVDGTEQGRLARTGRADHEAELAFADPEVEAAQNGGRRLRIGEGDVREVDHRSAPLVASDSEPPRLGWRLDASGDRRRPVLGAANAGTSATKIPSVASTGRARHRERVEDELERARVDRPDDDHATSATAPEATTTHSAPRQTSGR